MEIGNQIKALRQRKGVTQEALAEHLGITAQAVSKWERSTATPDIALLPSLSAFFGVTIDELFALSDDTRMERIQNMLWDVRFLNPADVENERQFLLDKARREPENGQPHAYLAQMENHIANEHRAMAEEYAKEAIRRDHTIKSAHSELTEAMGGVCGDWHTQSHHALIEYYKDFIRLHPDCVSGYLWLMEQLIDAGRYTEAKQTCEQMARYDNSFRTPFYLGYIAMRWGDAENANRHFSDLLSIHADEWLVWMSMGDIYARQGQYEDAKDCYRKYLSLQQPPRYTDGCTAIAQICEIQGDYAGAIEAVREEIDLLASDWNTTTGETVDQHLRNIARLKAKLQ